MWPFVSARAFAGVLTFDSVQERVGQSRWPLGRFGWPPLGTTRLTSPIFHVDMTLPSLLCMLKLVLLSSATGLRTDVAS